MEVYQCMSTWLALVLQMACHRTWAHTNVNLPSKAFVNTWSQWTSFRYVADNNATCSNCICTWIVSIVFFGSFSPTKGVHTRLQIWCPWTTLCRQYILGTMTWLPIFSSSLAVTCHVLNTQHNQLILCVTALVTSYSSWSAAMVKIAMLCVGILVFLHPHLPIVLYIWNDLWQTYIHKIYNATT